MSESILPLGHRVWHSKEKSKCKLGLCLSQALGHRAIGIVESEPNLLCIVSCPLVLFLFVYVCCVHFMSGSQSLPDTLEIKAMAPGQPTCAPRRGRNCLNLSICVCHPCAGAMLMTNIFCILSTLPTLSSVRKHLASVSP